MDDLADRAGVDTGEDLFCPECHYNLRGIDSERCPECGLAIDRAALAALGASRIPWTHRRRIGRVRAYVKTLWMVIARPGLLGEQSARPVSYPDARMFRVVTVALAYLPFLALGIFWGWNGKEGWNEIGILVDRPGDLAVTMLAGLLALACATGVGSWFARPQRLAVIQQNRAVAISQYACAPLVLLLPIGLVIGGTAWLGDHPELPVWNLISEDGQEGILITALITAIFALAVIPIAWWWCTLALLRVAAKVSLLRMTAAGLCLPLLWLLFLAAWVAGLHVVVSFAVAFLHGLLA